MPRKSKTATDVLEPPLLTLVGVYFMSLDFWYPWFPELYRAKTIHLTPEQDGLYRRLIDHYMVTRHPLLDNDAALARICGISIDSFTKSSALLKSFFKSENGFLHHDFCNAQLDEQDTRQKRKSAAGKKASKKRWLQAIENNNKNASAMRDPMRIYATDTDTDTLQDSKKKNLNINITKKKKIEKPNDVSDDIWEDFSELRKSKKAPITGTVLKSIRLEAAGAGLSLEDAMREMCLRGWQGFKAEWINQQAIHSGSAYRETNGERHDREIMEATQQVIRKFRMEEMEKERDE